MVHNRLGGLPALLKPKNMITSIEIEPYLFIIDSELHNGLHIIFGLVAILFASMFVSIQTSFKQKIPFLAISQAMMILMLLLNHLGFQDRLPDTYALSLLWDSTITVFYINMFLIPPTIISTCILSIPFWKWLYKKLKYKDIKLSTVLDD